MDDAHTIATLNAPDGRGPVVLLHDDFHSLSVGEPSSLWRLRPVGELVDGDGIITTGEDGLVVVPTAVNPTTGEPAFADAPQPLDDAGHLRWALMANRSASTGLPGFDVFSGHEIVVSADMAVRGYGLHRHPYGEDVPDPGRDLRPGAGLLVSVDLETGLVFDYIVTDRCVFGVYERLGFPGTDHAAFSYAVPLADRDPDDFHRLAIGYATSDGTVRWYIDGDVAMVVDRLGCRVLDDRYRRRDNGKPERAATPGQLTFGLALFTDRLWGQGFRLTVRSIEVSSRPV